MNDFVTKMQNEEATATNVAYAWARGNAEEGDSINGLTIIKLSDTSKITDGFAAVEMQDADGNIILGFAGTLPQLTGAVAGYSSASEYADAMILQGTPISKTPALEDAQTFAENAEDDLGSTGQLFVAGHSLGGIEAQAAAQFLESDDPQDFGGGATWAATGLPGNTAQGGPTSLVNYVEFGDLVGNWASDTSSPLSATVPLLQAPGGQAMYHYGTVTMIGNPADANGLVGLATDYQLLINAENQGNESTIGLESGIIISSLQQVLEYHGQELYAKDSGVTLLNPKDPSYSPPADPQDDGPPLPLDGPWILSDGTVLPSQLGDPSAGNLTYSVQVNPEDKSLTTDQVTTTIDQSNESISLPLDQVTEFAAGGQSVTTFNADGTPSVTSFSALVNGTLTAAGYISTSGLTPGELETYGGVVALAGAGENLGSVIGNAIANGNVFEGIALDTVLSTGLENIALTIKGLPIGSNLLTSGQINVNLATSCIPSFR